MKIKLIIIILLSFNVSGCTTTLGTALDTWVGVTVDEFVKVAGAPSKRFQFENGDILYSWDISCKVSLLSNKGIIKSWSSKNCASIHPVPGKWKREEKNAS